MEGDRELLCRVGLCGMGEGVLWTQVLSTLPFRPADPVEKAPLAASYE